jgi:hypothetical protein
VTILCSSWHSRTTRHRATRSDLSSSDGSPCVIAVSSSPNRRSGFGRPLVRCPRIDLTLPDEPRHTPSRGNDRSNAFGREETIAHRPLASRRRIRPNHFVGSAERLRVPESLAWGIEIRERAQLPDLNGVSEIRCQFRVGRNPAIASVPHHPLLRSRRDSHDVIERAIWQPPRPVILAPLPL